MKVRKKGRNRYIKMQEGGLGAFRSTSRYRGRGGGGMFGMSSIYHRHIEHFFHIFGGSTVFSLISESTRRL